MSGFTVPPYHDIPAVIAGLERLKADMTAIQQEASGIISLLAHLGAFRHTAARAALEAPVQEKLRALQVQFAWLSADAAAMLAPLGQPSIQGASQ